MLLRRHDSAREFLAASHAWLRREESANNLLLSFASRRAIDDDRNAEDCYVTVDAGGGVVLAATMGREGGVLLGGCHRPALHLLARELVESGLRPSGVVGSPAAARAFAQSYQALFPIELRPRHQLKHLALYTLPLPAVSPGIMRPAGAADLPFVERCWTGFREETRTQGRAIDLLQAVEHPLPGRGVVLWCAPEPVAMAAYTLLQPDTARLSAVFTAPDARRQGWASALVAELSRRLMLHGADDPRPRRACFLSTDAANPVSNAIYERIGFREQGEHLHLDFIDPAP